MEAKTLEHLEDDAIAIGHAAIADALSTKAGDVTFTWTRVRDPRGFTETPLAEALDLPLGCRVSPAATAFLVTAGAEVSYARSARLLEMAGGSTVTPTTVMGALRAAGELCAEQDEAAARSLYGDGVLPGGAKESEELCMEADGTWFFAQKPAEGRPRRLEIKAVVAYAGKEKRGGKVRRAGAVRHAMVGTPDEFMPQAVAAVGDGDVEEACRLIEGRAERVVAYLRGNAGAIAVEGPSLGTMESENQHLYGGPHGLVPLRVVGGGRVGDGARA